MKKTMILIKMKFLMKMMLLLMKTRKRGQDQVQGRGQSWISMMKYMPVILVTVISIVLYFLKPWFTNGIENCMPNIVDEFCVVLNFFSFFLFFFKLSPH